MSYKITMQYPNAAELPCKEFPTFNQLGLAEAAVIKKMREDAQMRIKITYRIREWDELVKEFDPAKITLPEEDAEGAQGQGKGATFRPTPLNTAPRPPGSPQGWLQDDEEEEK